MTTPPEKSDVQRHLWERQRREKREHGPQNKGQFITMVGVLIAAASLVAAGTKGFKEWRDEFFGPTAINPVPQKPLVAPPSTAPSTSESTGSPKQLDRSEAKPAPPVIRPIPTSENGGDGSPRHTPEQSGPPKAEQTATSAAAPVSKSGIGPFTGRPKLQEPAEFVITENLLALRRVKYGEWRKKDLNYVHICEGTSFRLQNMVGRPIVLRATSDTGRHLGLKPVLYTETGQYDFPVGWWFVTNERDSAILYAVTVSKCETGGVVGYGVLLEGRPVRSELKK